MKTILRTTLALVFIASTHLSSKAQDAPVHELGIQLSNLQGFSLIYKKERAENKLVRVQIGAGDYTKTFRKDRDPAKQLLMNMSCGTEKRKALGSKTKFVHGFIVHFSLFNQSDADNKISRRNLGIGYLMGVQYKFNDQFYISLESLPSVSGIITKRTNSDTEAGFNLGFYNNIANITLAHQFRKSRKPNK